METGIISAFATKSSKGETITLKFGNNEPTVKFFRNNVLIGIWHDIPFDSKNLHVAISLHNLSDVVQVKFTVTK